MVVWLIGISGAGKSTLGVKLKRYYESNNVKTFLNLILIMKKDNSYNELVE